MSDYIVTLNDIDDIRVLLRPVQGVQVGDDTTYLFDPALFEAYVELARKWAIGTIIEQPLGSSKYWAEQAAASAISFNPTNLVHITGTETITGIKTFSETILGNILTATSAGTLTTARNIAISGMATGTATSFDGSADISIPITAIQSASAIQAGVVDTAEQTIAGVKTFSSSPIVPSPTTDYQAATKKYVDDNAGGGSGSGLPLFASLYLDYIPSDASYVMSDGSSYVSGLVYTTAYAHLLADYTASTDTTETVGGVTVTYRRAADGHKIIDVANIANYQGVLSVTGTAWYYVLDQANTRFMLPFTNWFIQGGATTAGSLAAYQAAGLPNITGSGLIGDESVSTGILSTQGALYPSGSTSVGRAAHSGSYHNVSNITFSAQASNPIYGASTTVQPKANKLALYFVCGNTVVNEYLIDANGLADVDLSNISATAKTQVANYAMPSDTYDTLTLGASGTTYTAPANGFYYIVKNSGVSNTFIDFNNQTTGIIKNRLLSLPGSSVLDFVQVRKGDILSIIYNMTGTTSCFRFYYAQGEI